MRIRTFSDWAELTLKVPQTVGNMEYNQKLTLPEAESYLEKQKTTSRARSRETR